MKKIAVALLVLFSVGLLGAQELTRRELPPVVADTFAYFPATALKDAIATVRSGEELTMAFGKYDDINRGDHYFQGMNFRDKSEDGPGTHMDFADLYYVQEGEATLWYGGTVEGAEEVNIGEFRGGTIMGGTRQKLVAGDIASVPAGMPHMWEVEDGQNVVYVTFKLRKSAM